MARRTPYLGDYGLPVGGRSSGSRPKKSRYAASRKAAARNTRKAEQSLKYEKDMRKSQKKMTAKIDTDAARTNIRQSKSLKQKARGMQSKARGRAMKGKYSDAEFYNTMGKSWQQGADRLARQKGPAPMTPPKSKRSANTVVMDTGRKVVKAKKAVKKARSTERKINRLADFGDHIAKRAATLKAQRRASSGNRNMFLKEPKLSDH